MRDGLGGVERLAAADADHPAATVGLQLMAESVYLFAAALSVEAGRVMFHAVLLQAAHQGVARQLQHEVVGDHQIMIGEGFGVFANGGQRIGALNVFAW